MVPSSRDFSARMRWGHHLSRAYWGSGLGRPAPPSGEQKVVVFVSALLLWFQCSDGAPWRARILTPGRLVCVWGSLLLTLGTVQLLELPPPSPHPEINAVSLGGPGGTLQLAQSRNTRLIAFGI